MKHPFKIGILYKDRVFSGDVLMVTKIRMIDFDYEYEYYYLADPERSYFSFHGSVEDIWIPA